jgi:hypothetical protein
VEETDKMTQHMNPVHSWPGGIRSCEDIFPLEVWSSRSWLALIERAWWEWTLDDATAARQRRSGMDGARAASAVSDTTTSVHVDVACCGSVEILICCYIFRDGRLSAPCDGDPGGRVDGDQRVARGDIPSAVWQRYLRGSNVLCSCSWLRVCDDEISPMAWPR